MQGAVCEEGGVRGAARATARVARAPSTHIQGHGAKGGLVQRLRLRHLSRELVWGQESVIFSGKLKTIFYVPLAAEEVQPKTR